MLFIFSTLIHFSSPHFLERPNIIIHRYTTRSLQHFYIENDIQIFLYFSADVSFSSFSTCYKFKSQFSNLSVEMIMQGTSLGSGVLEYAAVEEKVEWGKLQCMQFQ